MTPLLDQSFWQEPVFPFLCIFIGIIVILIASMFRGAK